MNVFDLIKATVLCGGSAFLVHRFPVLSQVVVILLLAVLWASCADQAVRRVLQR